MNKGVKWGIAASVALSSAPVLAVSGTQTVFTATNGDSLRLSQVYNEDPEPSYYYAELTIDQATGIFAPFASTLASKTSFTATKFGQNPIFFVDAIYADGSQYSLQIGNVQNFGNYQYKSVFCEDAAAVAQQPVTCFGPSDIGYAFINYSSGDQVSTSQEVSGTVVSSPFVSSPAVPEPSTWALMLVGFGMVGAASRYRRRGAKVTFA